MRSIPRRDFVAQLLIGGAALSAAGCPSVPEQPRFHGAGHSTPQRGGTLMISEDSRIRMLDPHVAFDAVSGVVIELLFDSLYGYDRELQLKPMLAATLPAVTDGGRTFVVTLKEGVTFHNGRELVADDVVWSFERMLSPELQSPGTSYYGAITGLDAYTKKEAQHVSGIRALDRYRVQFSLTKPDQSFVHTLAMRFAAPVPREEVERLGEDFKRRPVGTGAFFLKEWDRGVRAVMVRNARYHRVGLPYLDSVVFEENLKRDTAFLRFRNGEIDIVHSLTASDRLLIKKPAFAPYTALAQRADVFGIAMNCQLAPFDNVHVRRAVSFAIDRERWARARNYAFKTTGQVLPPRIAGYDAKLPHLQHFDLERARAEMKLAGFPKGLSEPVTMWITENAAARAYGELTQADLTKIGIDVRLKSVSFPVWIEETGKPRTAQMMSTGWAMDYPDPSNFLTLMSTGMISETDSTNRSFYSNPKLDDLLDRALVEIDPDRRIALYREANDLVSDEAPWAFFANTQVPEAWAPYVKGYTPHPAYTLYLTDVWLDLPRKRVAMSERASDERFAARTNTHEENG